MNFISAAEWTVKKGDWSIFLNSFETEFASFLEDIDFIGKTNPQFAQNWDYFKEYVLYLKDVFEARRIGIKDGREIYKPDNTRIQPHHGGQ